MTKLILVTGLISLGITVLRPIGELNHLSPVWFSTETGGIQPRGVGWIVGITWLAAPLGILFAYRLKTLGLEPSSPLKAFTVALGGVVLMLMLEYGLVRRLQTNFPQILIFIRQLGHSL